MEILGRLDICSLGQVFFAVLRWKQDNDIETEQIEEAFFECMDQYSEPDTFAIKCMAYEWLIDLEIQKKAKNYGKK